MPKPPVRMKRRPVGARAVTRPRWRLLFGLLALALAAGSAAHAPLASASPSPQGGIERYVFYLAPAATGGLGDLCVGDRVAIDIKAERFLANRRSNDTGTTHPPVQVFGVTITGAPANPEVGTLSPASQMTSAGGIPPGSAQFVFTAKKPGSTELLFKGTKFGTGWFDQFIHGNRDYLSTALQATVQHCAYTVMIVSRFSVPGPANLKFMAVVAELHLSPDDQGHFTGTSTVDWLGGSSPVGDCSGSVAVGTSTVNATGDQDENGRLNIAVTYGPAQVSIISNCGAPVITVTPDPLHASVASTGGGTTRPQILDAPERAPGEALVLVQPSQ